MTARPRSLRWRIVAVVALLVTLTNLVVGVVVVLAFQGYLFGRLDADLVTASSRALSAQGDLPSPPPDGGGGGPSSRGDPDHDFIGAPGQSADTVVAVYRAGTFVLAGYTDASGAQHRLGSTATAVLADVPRDGVAVTRDLGNLGAYRLVATRANGSVFITGLPLHGVLTTVDRLVVVIVIVGVGGVLIAAWAGAVLVHRTLRPLSRVADTASAVTRLELERGDDPIPIRVADADMRSASEVAQVGTALNALLGHVSRAIAVRDRAERRVRDFVADASHELRTPLATIRAYAELSQRDADASPVLRRNVDRIGSEAVRMTDLVEELLLLARLDADGDGRAVCGAAVDEPVDLSQIVAEATMDARAAGPDHNWRLELDDDPVLVPGDAGQLRRVVLNLLTNARVHTPAGSTVRVGLHRATEGAMNTPALVTVTDDGPGIDASLVPTLFERFTRGDGSRSRTSGTTGLGLAIVHAVVTAHGGSVVVRTTPSGTTFEVTLPGS